MIADRRTREAAIIDPACNLQQIRHLLEEWGLYLTKILITHAHPDHIRWVHALVELYDVSVYVGRVEAEFYHYAPENQILVEDNEIILLGDTKIQCMLTPGHTIGSICYLLSKSFFTGDTMFIEGCGLCFGAGGSASDMFHSFQRIKSEIPDDVFIYPGHTYLKLPGQSMKFVRDYNIYMGLSEEENFVKFRNRKHQKNLFRFR